MKQEKVKDCSMIVLGIVLLAAGLVLVKIVTEPQGAMLALPYICIGIGCGLFGGGMGNIFGRKALASNPEAKREMEIAEKDERNVLIAAYAKAKAYDMMVFVFGALMVSFALMGVDVIAILLLVAVYLFVVGYGIFYRIKYEKEM